MGCSNVCSCPLGCQLAASSNSPSPPVSLPLPWPLSPFSSLILRNQSQFPAYSGGMPHWLCCLLCWFCECCVVAAESMSPAALGAAVLAICFKIAELCVSVADRVAKEDTELKTCVTRLLAATQPATTRMHRQECIQVWALDSTSPRYFA